MKTSDLKNRWEFHWPIMDVLIGGKSSIDLGHLFVTDWQDATEFVKTYGYDPDDARDARFIHGVIVEALHFVTGFLMPEEHLERLAPPEKIVSCQDVRELLLIASKTALADRYEQLWACSLLRVMHTIAHIEGVLQLADPAVAYSQIVGRFNRFVNVGENGEVLMGTPDDFVELERIDWKKEKSRQSMILKLLHKPANVAETINDLVGCRIVTKKLADTMLVVKYLRQCYMVSFPNCNPARARNTLIDTDKFRDDLELLTSQLYQSQLTPSEYEHEIEQHAVNVYQTRKGENPHSAASYRSIQLTARQLIRWPDPRTEWINRLEYAAKSGELTGGSTEQIKAIATLLRQWGGKDYEEHAAFFPFEIQILDIAAFEHAQAGDAAHDRYKRSQLRAARRRVLGELLRNQGTA